MSDGTNNRYGKQASPVVSATRTTFFFSAAEPLVGLWGYSSTTGGVNAIGVVQLNETIC